MKKLITIVILFCAFGVKSQVGKYFKYYNFGIEEERIRARKAFVPPVYSDTSSVPMADRDSGSIVYIKSYNSYY